MGDAYMSRGRRLLPMSAVTLSHGLHRIYLEPSRAFMFSLALLFVYVFSCPFSILITLLGEEGAGFCAYRAFVC